MLRAASALLALLLLLAGQHLPSFEPPSPPPSPPETDEITLTFLGDLLLSCVPGRYGGQDFFYSFSLHEPSWFLSCLSPVLQSDFCTFGNLENVLTDRDLPPVEKGYSPAYWYRSPTAVAALLADGGVDVLSLANNHTGDFGEAGRDDTRRALEEVGLGWGDTSRIVTLYAHGIRVAVCCCMIADDGGCTAARQLLRQACAESEVQIVYYHGGSMYDHTAPEPILRACRTLVDEGADLVIGHHPHVLQQTERYRGVLIAPSLGAVIFGDGRPENAGALLRVTVSICEGEAAITKTEFLPIRLWESMRIKWRPTFYEGPEAVHVIGFLKGYCASPLP